jgi:hypothetical protein
LGGPSPKSSTQYVAAPLGRAIARDSSARKKTNTDLEKIKEVFMNDLRNIWIPDG